MSEESRITSFRGLRVVLTAVAILCLLQFVVALLPEAVVGRLATLFGGLGRRDGLIPDEPLFWYSLREGAVMYLGVGLALLVMSRDPVRYRTLVKVAIVALGTMAVASATYGPLNAMPVLWYGADILVSLVFFVLLCVFYPRYLERRL